MANNNTSSANNTSKDKIADMKEKAKGLLDNKWVSIVVQVILGLLVTYIIYFISLKVMNTDKLTMESNFDIAKKVHVRVIDGVIDASTTNMFFNTSMPVASNYLPIRPSVNMKGGAQFTYNFWLYKDAGASVANKILFLKGDDKGYNFTIKNNNNSKAPVVTKTNTQMVFCPMFQFGGDGNSFNINFNTLNRYDETFSVTTIAATNDAYRNNLLSTLDNTWYMITVTFEDNIPINDFENGIVVKFYVNSTLYQTGRFASALKQNHGDLYMFPNNNDPITNVQVSNFNYFNYVLSDEEIARLAYGGANTRTNATASTNVSSKPPVLSDYNILDIYNA